jgi:hypothetical protein
MFLNRVFCLIAVPEGQVPVMTQERDVNQNMYAGESCQSQKTALKPWQGKSTT